MITHRGLLVHPYELDDNWLDKCVSLGLNVIGLHPVGGKKADESLQALLDMQHEPAFERLLARASSLGLKVEHEMHALSWLVPRSLFAENPDWFRMDESGARVADFNICPSCKEAMAYLADRSEELARHLPSETHRYYFWIDDVTKSRCHCPACAALTASDQQMMIINAMVEGVRRVDPLGSVPYLAYRDTLNAPTAVKPAQGVFLEFAPIWRKPDYAINDPSCPENAQEISSIPDLLALFGTKDSQVLEYWLDNSLYSKWTYPPQPFKAYDDIIAQDIAYYRDLGFERITTFACYLGKDYIDLHGEPDLTGYGKAFANP